MRYITTMGLIVAAACSSASAGLMQWDFNVFSRSTIGSPGQGYGSKFEGASGSVGNAWFSNFQGHSVPSASPALPGAHYGGGSFTLSGSVNGNVYAAGTVTMNNASVYGDVYSGGNLAGAGGTVYGSAYLNGAKTAGGQLVVTGSTAPGSFYSAPVDLESVSSYFGSVGSSMGSMSSTTSYSNYYGKLLINASGPLTIVNMTRADYISAWGVEVTGAGAVVINVAGDNISVASKTWSYQGGASANSTLLNFPTATSLTLTGSQTVNILAANAATSFSSGTITGNLIVHSLTGSGSTAWNGGFTQDAVIAVPAPGGAVLGALAGLMVARRTRRGR